MSSWHTEVWMEGSKISFSILESLVLVLRNTSLGRYLCLIVFAADHLARNVFVCLQPVGLTLI